MKYKLGILLLLFSLKTYCQINKSDSTLMYISLKVNKIDNNSSFQLINETLADSYLIFEIVKDTLEKNELDIPSNILPEFINALEKLESKPTPKFSNAILIDKYSEQTRRLSINFDAAYGTSVEEIEDFKKEMLKKVNKLKDDYKPEELIVYEVSTPIYSNNQKQAICLVKVIEPGIQNLYFDYFIKKGKKWLLKYHYKAYTSQH